MLYFSKSKVNSKSLFIASALFVVSLLSSYAIAQEKSNIIIRGSDGWLFPRWGSLKDLDLDGIDRNSKLISLVKNNLEKKSVKLEVLVIPDKVRFYQEKMPENEKYSENVEKRYDVILKKLNNYGISTLDGESVLRKVKNSGQEVFYRTDQHWTQAAADAMAVASAEMIKKIQPELSGMPGTGMALGSEQKERRYGDLAELFLSSDDKKSLGRETFVVRKEVAETKLIDDQKAPVHVTGHSMVQPYFGFPQKLSNAIDRPVSLNWKSGNVGPWVMLLEYLNSSEFKSNKPQVILWQMFEPAYSHGPNAKGMWDNASIMEESDWLSRIEKSLQD